MLSEVKEKQQEICGVSQTFRNAGERSGKSSVRFRISDDSIAAGSPPQAPSSSSAGPALLGSAAAATAPLVVWNAGTLAVCLGLAAASCSWHNGKENNARVLVECEIVQPR